MCPPFVQQLGFIAHVGDLIDGKNNKGHSIPAMQRVLAEFEKAQCKTHYFAIGLYYRILSPCFPPEFQPLIRRFSSLLVPLFVFLHSALLIGSGNHELYNFEKSDLQHFFRTKSNYFHFAPAPGVRMIQLDSYHINCITKDNSAEFHLGIVCVVFFFCCVLA